MSSAILANPVSVTRQGVSSYGECSTGLPRSKIAEHRTNVLVCDIEGSEAVLPTGADLKSVRLIQMEIHYC